ncbi:hypothetical protein OEZ85_012604 [Tetradesmus obliquus]|uniref:FAS1 domain-containing protein n=1 Tax=Tetradesmus obliquus TaxID=3088 RepID=A0ABY8U3B5_TETOB|nr:hypothetical protein OEZ85_012604 [Tetradesmus obliquus]
MFWDALLSSGECNTVLDFYAARFVGAIRKNTVSVWIWSREGVEPRRRMRVLLLTVLACVVLFGSASALGLDDIKRPSKPDSKPHVYPKGGCSACSATTAWDYISSTPSLSAVAGLIKAIGLDKALMGPFTGTLALPTNEAVAAYVAQIKADTAPYPDVFNNFLTKLLNYHFILRSAPAWQLDTVTLSTRYRNPWTAGPHTVTFVVDPSVSKRAPKDWQWSRKSMHNRPMPRVFAVTHIVDEQGNNVTFASKDNFVLGGGVIHSINAVLNANDIYPSHTASANSIPEKEALLDLITQVSAALNISMLELLEDRPGTILSPTSEAFAKLQAELSITPTPQQLYDVLAYHFCPSPDNSVKGLLYFPFTKNKKYNPCKTLLATNKPTTGLPGLLFSNTPTGLTTPQDLTVTYLNGLTGGQGTSNIVLTGITTPLAVTHLVDTVMVPPLGALAPAPAPAPAPVP